MVKKDMKNEKSFFNSIIFIFGSIKRYLFIFNQNYFNVLKF